MKIAFLNIYQDVAKRGVETFVSEVSSRLSKQNHVHIISGGDISTPEWNKSFLWRLFLDKNSLAILKFTIKKIPQIWKEKYDVVLPMNNGWQSVILRIVTWMYGGKIVIVGQSGIGWHDRVNLLTFPNTFIALTKFASNWSRKINPYVKVINISNGVDLNKFKPTTKSKGKSKTIISISALTREKRNDLTIKAVAKLKNVKLIIVGGGGELKDEIRTLGLNTLGEDKFNILTTSYSEIPSLLTNSDLLAFPSSSWESFGIVLLEALASGIPIVATDDPIRKEIVGDAGLYVDPTNIDAYANALNEALNKNWGNKPRNQAEKFSWDKIALQYEELFKNL